MRPSILGGCTTLHLRAYSLTGSMSVQYQLIDSYECGRYECGRWSDCNSNASILVLISISQHVQNPHTVLFFGLRGSGSLARWKAGKKEDFAWI